MRIDSPEELETLLEDALLLGDDEAVAALFARGVVVASGDQVHDGVPARDLLALRGFAASCRPPWVGGGIALGASAGAVIVSTRRPDRTWQLLAVVLR